MRKWDSTDAVYGTMSGTRTRRIANGNERMAMIINQLQRRCCGALSAQPASCNNRIYGACVWSMLVPFVLSCPDRDTNPLNTSTLSRTPGYANNVARGFREKASGVHQGSFIVAPQTISFARLFPRLEKTCAQVCFVETVTSNDNETLKSVLNILPLRKRRSFPRLL